SVALIKDFIERKMHAKLWALVALFTTFSSTYAAGVDSTYSWQNVEIGGGGFVPGITFSPLKKDLIYARMDIGGCYRWNPATNRWVQLLNWVSAADWDLTGVDSMIPDPVNVYELFL
ncbi:hypothetical protein HK096_010531, partial [Nowakowskiella sp. JEL0078]